MSGNGYDVCVTHKSMQHIECKYAFFPPMKLHNLFIKIMDLYSQPQEAHLNVVVMALMKIVAAYKNHHSNVGCMHMYRCVCVHVFVFVEMSYIYRVVHIHFDMTVVCMKSFMSLASAGVCHGNKVFRMQPCEPLLHQDNIYAFLIWNLQVKNIKY